MQIEDVEYTLTAGEQIIMPVDIPHGVAAQDTHVKMVLTIDWRARVGYGEK